MSDRVVILGATSGIAKAVCREMAAAGTPLLLCGRTYGELALLAEDLRIRHNQKVPVETLDALDSASHAAFVQRCLEKCDGKLGGVILCYGDLTPQADTQTSAEAARKTIEVNFTSAVTLLHAFAEILEKQKQGYIAAISSVAGDRGRQSNYTYGAAKAGLTAFLAGLRNRLFRHGVHVLTIKPGFVDTPMTQGMLNPKSPLVATPERVAKDIVRAIRKRKNTIYTAWFWRYIMLIIRSVPEPIFKRLKL